MGARNSIPYNAEYTTKKKILANGETGDIILWAGKGDISNLVRCFSRDDKWSHVGLIVKDPYTCELYLLESNNEFMPRDELTRKYKDGVKLSNLKKKMNEYNGYYIAWRKLDISNDLWYDEHMFEKLLRFIKANIGKHYTKDIIELLNSVSSSNTENAMDSFFCTKLAASSYIAMGILSKKYKDPNNYTLFDFTSDVDLRFTRKTIKLSKEKFVTLEQ